MSKLTCDKCGDIPFAIIDGYDFGDRLLEGVKFAVTLKGKKYVAQPLLNRDEKYLDDLNKKKWLRNAVAHAEEVDLLICSKCHGEVVNPLYKEENPPPIVSVPVTRLADIFDTISVKSQQKKGRSK